MKVKAMAAAAALVFSVGVSADVIDLGDVTLSGGDSFFAMGFISHAAGETFSDYFLFTLNDPGVTSWRGAANFNTPTLSLSGILCVRHNMSTRSMYAKKDQQEEH